MELPSPYEILGVPEKTENLAEIKAAYRSMALKYHPDKNPNAGDKFQEISKAYQILSNEDSKLFFDSFGYEGLILNERLNSKGEKNFMEWVISLAFCLLSIVLDYFFNIYTEWIFASLFTIYFIFLTKKSPDLPFIIFVIVSNLILYFILPTRILPTLTNTIIYGIVLLWPNITRKNSTITVSIWVAIIWFDYWRGITLNHWIWNILSINILIFGSIILMLMGIYVLKKPETGPGVYSGIFYVIVETIQSLDFMTFIFVLFWGPIWLMDYFFNRRIEWLIPPVIFIIKLLVFNGKLKIFIPMIMSSAIVYYLVPTSIYNFLSNYIIHVLSHLLVYKFNVAIIEKAPEQITAEQRSKHFLKKSINQLVMGIILIVIQYYLDFDTSHWFFLGSISLGYSFILVIELYFFMFSIKNDDDSQQQNNNNSNTQIDTLSTEFQQPQQIYQQQIPQVFQRKQKPIVNNNNNNNSNHLQNELEQEYNNNDSDTNNNNNNSIDENNNNNDQNDEVTDQKVKRYTNTTKSLTRKKKSALDKRCQTCFKATDLKKCGNCKQVYYCSKECQLKNWPFHRNLCTTTQS